MKQRKEKKIFITLALTFVLVFTLAVPGFALESGTPSPQVMLNGDILHFKTAPVIVDGRMLVTADEFNDLVAAPLGLEVSADSGVASVNVNGIQMIPLRSLCDRLGLSLSWDMSARTAVIIDFDSLLGDIDAQYSILNTLMKLSYDPDKTYRTTSDSSGSMKVDSGEEVGTMTTDIKASVDMLNKNANMSGSFRINLNYDLADLTQQMPEDQMAIMEQMLDPLKDFEIKMIFNAKEEIFYIQLGSLADLLAMTFGTADIDANTWIKADLTSLIDTSGYESFIRALLSGDMSVMNMEALMNMIFNRSDAYQSDDYENLCLALDLMAELFSDKAFVVSGSDTQPTYELSLNAQKLQSALVTVAIKHPSILADGLGDTSLTELQELLNYNIKMKFTVKGPHEYAATISYQYDMDMAELLGLENGNIKMDMNVESEFPGKTVTDLSYLYHLALGSVTVSTSMSLKDTTVVNTTNETVPDAPPAGAKVIDMTALFSNLIPVAETVTTVSAPEPELYISQPEV